MKIFGRVTGITLFKNQWQQWREHFKRPIVTQPTVDDFTTIVQQFRLTTAQLRQQYQQRYRLSWLLLGFGLLSLSLSLLWPRSLLCTLFLSLLYLNNSLRLYQLRHCTLCRLRTYLVAIRQHWREGLPQPLPSTWQGGV